MNHKLRVLVRVDVDPGHVTLEVTGCLTQSDFPALLHIIRRAGRLGAGSNVIIDLHGSSHLDPEILLQLRSIADASAAAPGTGAGSPDGTAAGQVPFRITLAEPADLPICLMHVGSDGEVLAGLEGELAAVPLPDAAAESLTVGVAGVSPGFPAGTPAGLPAGGTLNPGLDEACSPIPDELNTINGLALSEYFEGTLDPAATVRALSDVALGQLADALYRHLDTSSPSFGAHTWYELATEELQNRHLGDGNGPAEGELAAGPALA
ncbi:hypothetical protein [Arthrobacter sp. Leaf69]|uniref:hypothetical protein n=1 Tax=Arthrobacter sp. Leaf69 TaxID=1736232 RepID=UPI0006FF477C|nr:hypothetical protein [Arthrobacter sp. Leaf69]KQN89229.1 hypothetical protein ASE96_06430 [Arthrobacter sp. Leaf69]